MHRVKILSCAFLVVTAFLVNPPHSWADDHCLLPTCPLNEGCGFCLSYTTGANACATACNGAAGTGTTVMSCGVPSLEITKCACTMCEGG